ncbi:MAG: hypothetical protein K6G73_08715 [Marinilabiliaceae bacterium]|nr:hypothetical protein [Marinilabiliaceae bacterium]
MLAIIKEVVKTIGTDMIVTIIIAIVGWAFAFYQMIKNRNWQKKDMLANRRYEAYQTFMKKLDEITGTIRNNPNAIYGVPKDLMTTLIEGDDNVINEALVEFNQKLVEYVKESVQPLIIINQEINPLLLIASDELMLKLNRLKALIEDFYNEVQNCLSAINTQDGSSFKVLETIGHNERWREFQTLNDEIIKLIRKEINV